MSPRAFQTIIVASMGSKDRLELESKVLAAALKQSHARGDTSGVSLAHRQIFMLLRAQQAESGDSALSAARGSSDASTTVTGLPAQAQAQAQAQTQPDEDLMPPEPPEQEVEDVEEEDVKGIKRKRVMPNIVWTEEEEAPGDSNEDANAVEQPVEAAAELGDIHTAPEEVVEQPSHTDLGTPSIDLTPDNQEITRFDLNLLTTESPFAEEYDGEKPTFDAYGILNVDQIASFEEIHRAFLFLVRRTLLQLKKAKRKQRRPLLDDLQNLWIAHDILSDPVTRTDFDFRILGLRGAPDVMIHTAPEDKEESSITTRTPLRIGELMQCAGLLEQTELEIAADMHKAMPEMLFGAFLVKQGFISDEDLTQVLVGQRLLKNGSMTVGHYQLCMKRWREDQTPIETTAVSEGLVTQSEMERISMSGIQDPSGSQPRINAEEAAKRNLSVGHAVPLWKDQLDWSEPEVVARKEEDFDDYERRPIESSLDIEGITDTAPKDGTKKSLRRLMEGIQSQEQSDDSPKALKRVLTGTADFPPVTLPGPEDREKAKRGQSETLPLPTKPAIIRASGPAPAMFLNWPPTNHNLVPLPVVAPSVLSLSDVGSSSEVSSPSDLSLQAEEVPPSEASSQSEVLEQSDAQSEASTQSAESEQTDIPSPTLDAVEPQAEASEETNVVDDIVDDSVDDSIASEIEETAAIAVLEKTVRAEPSGSADFGEVDYDDEDESVSEIDYLDYAGVASEIEKMAQEGDQKEEAGPLDFSAESTTDSGEDQSELLKVLDEAFDGILVREPRDKTITQDNLQQPDGYETGETAAYGGLDDESLLIDEEEPLEAENSETESETEPESESEKAPGADSECYEDESSDTLSFEQDEGGDFYDDEDDVAIDEVDQEGTIELPSERVKEILMASSMPEPVAKKGSRYESRIQEIQSMCEEEATIELEAALAAMQVDNLSDRSSSVQERESDEEDELTGTDTATDISSLKGTISMDMPVINMTEGGQPIDEDMSDASEPIGESDDEESTDREIMDPEPGKRGIEDTTDEIESIKPGEVMQQNDESSPAPGSEDSYRHQRLKSGEWQIVYKLEGSIADMFLADESDAESTQQMRPRLTEINTVIPSSIRKAAGESTKGSGGQDENKYDEEDEQDDYEMYEDDTAGGTKSGDQPIIKPVSNNFYPNSDSDKNKAD
ncbi:MAG: hypothetical protein K2X93_02185 [Candidatus Obscuribacterales bacterium]|nr:hypothetical protein [Candidatus Obscuribacterales bacterium]